MLKWTNSAARDNKRGTMERELTPHIKIRLRKRASVCELNEKNLVPITYTSFATHISNFHEAESVSSEKKRKTTTHMKGSSQFASTLPRFEEEYSPNTILLSGQELTSREFLPDIFISNQRYFKSPFLPSTEFESCEVNQKITKRKLEFELKEKSPVIFESSNKLACEDSTKINDHSLNKLIDDILESTYKIQNQKKFRKSFNLKRRLILKTNEDSFKNFNLSPSYAAGEDPAGVICELLAKPQQNLVTHSVTPSTPLPHTPTYNNSMPHKVLLGLPTPVSKMPLPTSPSIVNISTTTFKLPTPVRETYGKSSKKFQKNNLDVLEVGLALPSIYV